MFFRWPRRRRRTGCLKAGSPWARSFSRWLAEQRVDIPADEFIAAGYRHRKREFTDSPRERLPSLSKVSSFLPTARRKDRRRIGEGRHARWLFKKIIGNKAWNQRGNQDRPSEPAGELRQWADILHWNSMEEARKASEALLKDPIAQEFMRKIDPASVRMLHLMQMRKWKERGSG